MTVRVTPHAYFERHGNDIHGVVPITIWGQFPEGWPLLGSADRATVAARVLTVVYFLFFLLMPWYTARDKTKPVPERVTG